MESNNFITNDLSVAAFLLAKGYKIIKAEKEIGGKFYFEIDDHDNRAHDVSLMFLSSECFSYDGYVRMLRSMLHADSKRSR
jgi:hypothetical protein